MLKCRRSWGQVGGEIVVKGGDGYMGWFFFFGGIFFFFRWGKLRFWGVKGFVLQDIIQRFFYVFKRFFVYLYNDLGNLLVEKYLFNRFIYDRSEKVSRGQIFYRRVVFVGCGFGLFLFQIAVRFQFLFFFVFVIFMFFIFWCQVGAGFFIWKWKMLVQLFWKFWL